MNLTASQKTSRPGSAQLLATEQVSECTLLSMSTTLWSAHHCLLEVWGRVHRHVKSSSMLAVSNQRLCS